MPSTARGPFLNSRTSCSASMPSRSLTFATLVGGLVETRERRGDEPGERVEVVAALEHGGGARGERGRTSRQLAEPLGRDEHLRERVLLVRVEARGDEDELGLERPDGRLHQLVE